MDFAIPSHLVDTLAAVDRLLAERISASFAAFIALGNLSFPIAVQAGLLTL